LPNLALFDFDGTITTNDNFTAFVRMVVSPWRLALGKIILMPFIVGYKAGVLSPSRLRRMIIMCALSGKKEVDLVEAGRKYAIDRLPPVMKTHAIKKIDWHKSQGDTIVVVSASLNFYLASWCAQYQLDLICSRLEVRNGLITGRYHGQDCTGREKATRVLSKYNLKSFEKIYAYGDSAEDIEMLNLADIKIWCWQDDGKSAAAT
jgi:HAD superfamily hydrolase (TIGR01490 family)